MTRIAYVDGRYRPIGAPAVRVEDRGLQFADGVYEVIKCLGGRLCDLERHLDRLERSLAALAIPMPASRRRSRPSSRRRCGATACATPWSISRSTAASRRATTCSRATPRPTLIVTVRRASLPKPRNWHEGVGVVTLPDQRWKRCDIKSVSLLANVLARQQAASAGCREVWLYDADGWVTEGAGSNAYIVDGDGRLVTRALGPEILGGVTREVVLELARAEGIAVVERPFTVAEAYAAREAFLTSTSSLVLPVTAIDGRTVANGMPGSVTRRLLQRYRDHLMKAG